MQANHAFKRLANALALTQADHDFVLPILSGVCDG